MNDKQRVITATFVVALFVAAFFFVPWIRHESNDIRYAPFYRNPITLESAFSGSTVYRKFVRMKGRPLYSLYFLQLVGIAGTGFVLYRLARTKDSEE
ncbi:MAG: hypothetical protein KJO98_07420 [Rhodothermia bacterium]|nr:hypothetical protein [Rhodothermia bacterium]